MRIATLQDLLFNNMTDIYTGERLLLRSLPVMVSLASSPSLREALEAHLAETGEQVERLKTAFELLKLPAMIQTCPGIAGIIKEAEEIAAKDIEREVLDAAIIAASQRIEHYEIAAYGTLSEYARALRLPELQRLFEMTLAEEKAADQILSGLAEGGINAMAEGGAGSSRAVRGESHRFDPL
jgi:ferritin-like metal-binding protein YciE